MEGHVDGAYQHDYIKLRKCTLHGGERSHSRPLQLVATSRSNHACPSLVQIVSSLSKGGTADQLCCGGYAPILPEGVTI